MPSSRKKSTVRIVRSLAKDLNWMSFRAVIVVTPLVYPLLLSNQVPVDWTASSGYDSTMQSLFKMGFSNEVFSYRSPEMGLSISQLEADWKQYYPQAKADLKPLITPSTPAAAPGTVPVANSDPSAPTYPPGTPVNSPTNLQTSAYTPSSGGGGMGIGTTLLVVGGLAVLGGGAFYLYKNPKILRSITGKKK